MAELLYQDGMIRMESVSQVTQTPSHNLGERCTFNGEEYVYAYNAGGGSIATTTAKGVKFITNASGYSIAATALTDVYSPFAGIVKHAAMASGDYGWIMVRGFATVSVVSASTGEAKMVALGAAGSFIEASGTTVGGTAAVVGMILSSHNTAAGGSVYGFFKANA